MTKLWNDLKKNMLEWGSVAVEKAEEVSKIAVAKTEELTKISKIRLETHQLQRELNKTFEDLGRFTAREAQTNNMVNFTGNTEFFNYLQKAGDLRIEIDKKELEIQKIKDEYDLKESDIILTETEEKPENADISEDVDEQEKADKE
ncbi:MAG: hypothetical protein ISS10_01100 [Candidatus Marinimicrobia bacterium]|nr:hypothetical protein [Candidatus Neomarinimicrobiota bacterium]MBL7059576.1 hypothetical protein [Candidatus Neomarinimicrobiota bacterium]